MSKQQLYDTPSGLGGAFTVKVVEHLEGGLVRVRVHMPRNRDWHGHTFETYRNDLTPLAEKKKPTQEG